MSNNQEQEFWTIEKDYFEHKVSQKYELQTAPGLTEETIRQISKDKNEPSWMLDFRLRCFELYKKLPMPNNWPDGPDLKDLDLQNISYYIKPGTQQASDWNKVPEEIKKTFERLGIPEAERHSLAGAGAQFEAEVVYHNLKKQWEDLGVLFTDCDVALKEHPELFKKYFMKCVPPSLHKFAALHGACWSGGTFIHVPKGVKIDLPLQAYFRMNVANAGQFEHTLIIVDEGAEVQYLEGCSAPTYSTSSLHAGCVEIFVHKGARARYSSMENWAKNVFNLNTKRAIVDEDGVIEWVNGNMGCLTEDSLVYTNPKGPTKIVSIKPGDHVFALDEKEKKLKKAKVKAVVYSGDKKVYNLRVAGREVKASSNHPFLTLQKKRIKPDHKKNKFYLEWKPLETVKEGDLIAIAKKLPDMGRPYKLPRITYGDTIMSNNQYSKFSMNTKHLFNEINIPDHTIEDLMWFFGVYIGDGNLWKPKKGGAKINLAIHEKTDLRKPLLETTKRVFNYEVKYQKDRYIIINSNILAKLLEELGFGGLANSKRIPRWVYTLPINQRLAFLGGYFDADGHAGKAGVYLTSINEQLLEDFKQLAIGCGIGVSRIFNHMPSGKRIILGKECNASGSYRLLLNGKGVVHIGTKSILYRKKLKNLRTKRNYSTGNKMNFVHQTSEELGFAKVDEIKYEGVKPTYDIEVENYHNFIANGIIVHNSRTTMLYPCSILKGKNARADFLGVAVASKNQFQDTGAKVIHAAPNTSSTIRSKSISKDGGITTYRGLVQVAKNATNAKVYVQCDALMLDDRSKSNTVPYMDVDNKTAEVGHEATVSKIGDEQLFYLMSRGLSEEQARQMIVSGFIEPIVKALPIEYAVEFNRLIELEMENALG